MVFEMGFSRYNVPGYMQCVIAIFYYEGRQDHNVICHVISETGLSPKDEGYLNMAIDILFFAEKMMVSHDELLEFEVCQMFVGFCIT